jgi:hypothetical protein
MLREQLFNFNIYFLLCLAHHHHISLMQPSPNLQLAMDQIAERTARVLGRNAGIADSVMPFDHRAADQSTDTFQWHLNSTRLLAPTAGKEPATSIATATRAFGPQLKAPF